MLAVLYICSNTVILFCPHHTHPFTVRQWPGHSMAGGPCSPREVFAKVRALGPLHVVLYCCVTHWLCSNVFSAARSSNVCVFVCVSVVEAAGRSASPCRMLGRAGWRLIPCYSKAVSC